MTNIIKLPGLIDTHVHLREPGLTHKEDFESGTKAAIAGGYTVVLDMPNNPNPITNPEALAEKIKLAEGVIAISRNEEAIPASSEIAASPRSVNMNVAPRNDDTNTLALKGEGQGEGYSRIYCDLGFHFGASEEAIKYFGDVQEKVFGLKVYMNHTTGELLIEDKKLLNEIFEAWPKDKVLMVHAETETLAMAIELAKKHGNTLHVCHVARKIELELIKQAKSEGLPITCEVSLHHLYLTHEDEERLRHFGMMRPPLASPEDVQYLWDNIDSIDTIASDHAPHTKEEKESEKVVNGVPGLETSLPLLLNAINDERLTINDLIRLTSENPRKIFNIPKQQDTYVEVDLDAEWTISNDGLFTKAGWTPFAGMKIKGKILKTVLRGETVFENGEIKNAPSGKVIFPK